MIEHACHVAENYFDVTREDAARFVTALRGYSAALEWARKVMLGETPPLLPSLLAAELPELRGNQDYIDNTLILIAADAIAQTREPATPTPDHRGDGETTTDHDRTAIDE